MPIRLTRLRAGKWYAAGTVRVGGKSVTVKEHSTGFDSGDEEGAQDYCRTETVRITRELLHGRPAQGHRITWAEALARYQGVKSYVTVPRLAKFTEQFGDMTLDQITATEWRIFETAHLAGLAQPTLNDYRGLFRKVLTDAGFTVPPDLAKALQRKKPRPRPPAWLTAEEADALTACYAPHARCIAVTARYQGMRAGEIARLEWRDVDLDRNSLFIRETKNGRARTVPMHPMVRDVLSDMHSRRQVGAVFLTPSGAPYSDTRERGGNAFRKAHEGAVRRAVGLRSGGAENGVYGPKPAELGQSPAARNNSRNNFPPNLSSGPPLYPGIFGFRFHDWRHHFAIQAIRDGVDLVTLMNLCGWESLEAANKYVHADFDHMAKQLRRVR